MERAPGSTPSCDVLVVDDEQVVRDGIRRILGASGYRVEVADDAATGLAHPALRSCRLVVCDLMLPDRMGTDLVREIRAARPDVSVVVITGYATSLNGAAALAAGADDFLPKPFDEEELLAVVRRAIDLRADPSGAARSPGPPDRPGPSGGGGS